MKKIRKVLIAVFSVMLLVCMGLFAACDNGNSNSNDNGGTSGNEQTETTYTVTYALGDHAATDAQVPAAATATEANGYKVTLPAAPKAADGWKFNGWRVGSDVKQVGDEITVSANLTVTAQWVEDVPPAVTYTVTYSLGDHAAADATVPAAATANEANGYKVTLPAAVEAAEGWKFTGWKVGSDTELKAAGAEITVSADVTVTAQWVEDVPPAVTYTVTYALGDHAAAGVTAPAAVEANEENGYKVTLPAALGAAVGYRFVGWKVGNDTKDAGSEITVSESITVTAVWEEKHNNQYTDVPVGTWGQALPRNYTLQKGDAVILSGSFSGKLTGQDAAGNDCIYQGIVAQVFVNGVVGNNDNYYFFRPDCPVQVVNNEWKYWGDSGCTWTTPAWVADSYKAEAEGSVVVTVALSDAGVLTVEVAFTGTSYSYTNLYTVSAPMESALVFFAADGCTPAKASVKHYTASEPVEYVDLTLTCGDNGTATLDPAPVAGEIVKGTSVKLTVTPAANYEVDSVKVNNSPVELTGSEYTFTADADTTVEVSFKAQLVNLTLTCGDNGTATLDPEPDTDGKIAKGTSAKLTLTPASDPDQYIVNTVILKSGADDEGTDVTADLVGNEYTFVVTGDVELVVTFKKFEAVTSIDTAYNGTWNCVVKGESTFSSTVSVTASRKRISISGSVVTATVTTSTPYTATLGYTVYVEGSAIEECYTIYLVPGLNDKILALSLNGETTYFIKSGTTSSSDVTIDEAFMNADGSEGSSWYGGAASMPISFEFGKLKIDGQEAIFLAESKTDSGLVYTVYANGGLYQLIYTKADDSMVLHPYGNSTEDDTPYERETPPDPVLVPQFAGKYSNNEHTVDIDADGNFSFDGTVRKLYYDAQTRVYTFNTSQREYTVKFSTTVEVFNAAANENWTLKKIEEGTAQYTLTVNCENGTVAYSAKNAENKYWAGSSVTLSITANKHFEVEKVTVNGEDAKTTDDAGVIKVTVTINADTTVEVIFKELKEENLLSDLYQGVYKDSTFTVTITATEVTVRWSSGYGTFNDTQITHTGEGKFTLVNGNRKFTFTFSNENKTLKVGDSNWAVDGNTHTLTKEES